MMTEHRDDQAHEGPPEDLVEQVRDGLEHLYDLSHLQRHSLLGILGCGADTSLETSGQQLRRRLVAAIETLNPGAGVSFRAPHARLYHVLVLHYVEGRIIRDVAQELALSERQAFRNLRSAIESMSAVLWERRSLPAAPERSANELSSFQAEMARLGTDLGPVDVCTLLQRAQEAVGPLAARRNVHLRSASPPGPVMVSTDAVVAQQVLVGVLSRAIQQAEADTLRLALSSGEGAASLELRYFATAGAAGAPAVDARTAHLADRLGWAVSQEDRPEGDRAVTLGIGARRQAPAVLVIDDNEGLVRVIQRYLGDRDCRVISAANGRDGLRLAREATPDAIVLDVMMPQMQGWEVLQRLRSDPETAGIPVVVCSVINDPELAYSLGASLLLAKPVTQQAVLNALHQLGVV